MSSRRGAVAGLIVAGLAMALAVVAWPESPEALTPSPASTSDPLPAPTNSQPADPAVAITAVAPVAEGAAPRLDLVADTFEELRAVWEQIDAYWAWLYANPSNEPGVLEEILHPEGDQFSKQTETVAGLLERGWRLVADTAIGEVTAFGCCPDPQAEMDTGTIKLAIQTTWPDSRPAVMVDVDGKVVEELPGWELQSWLVTLRRATDGRWLVAEVEGR